MIDELLAMYDWFDHPEGLKYVIAHGDAYSNSGHWLFLPGTISAFHKVHNSEEYWLIHWGHVLVHVFDPAGAHHVLRLGTDLAAGERPMVTVPVNYWQAAEIPEKSPFAFGTNVCAPPFSFDEFTIARREDLLQEFPDHREVIMRLTLED